ncbi:hypothetical protein HYPDE_38208 [Hyphomicrobium denitrificans 1NES1]|uniref:Uncharacterized protein n=1 Tax=Hyphomicrobium denitrificans 1NES1 TaxID=670307 RepID=N0B8E8_9HYPH|nr:hypothetical protein HYPDE_38208 [Hyphomicrobium denitrificans 1NES1]
MLEVRSEAEAILGLCDQDLTKLFFEQTMRRNLSRTVRRLDLLIEAGSEEDRALGEKALSRLGFLPGE